MLGGFVALAFEAHAKQNWPVLQLLRHGRPHRDVAIKGGTRPPSYDTYLRMPSFAMSAR